MTTMKKKSFIEIVRSGTTAGNVIVSEVQKMALAVN